MPTCSNGFIKAWGEEERQALPAFSDMEAWLLAWLGGLLLVLSVPLWWFLPQALEQQQYARLAVGINTGWPACGFGGGRLGVAAGFSVLGRTPLDRRSLTRPGGRGAERLVSSARRDGSGQPPMATLELY